MEGRGSAGKRNTASNLNTFQDLRHLEELHHGPGLHLALGAALGGSGTAPTAVPRGAAKRKAASALFPAGQCSLNVVTLAASAATISSPTHLAIPPSSPGGSSSSSSTAHLNSGPGRRTNNTTTTCTNFSLSLTLICIVQNLSLSHLPLYVFCQYPFSLSFYQSFSSFSVFLHFLSLSISLPFLSLYPITPILFCKVEDKHAEDCVQSFAAELTVSYDVCIL